MPLTIQPTITQTPAGLDPQAFAAAKALRRTETGTSTDPYNAKGASGEFGAYQFMPATYKSLAKKYLGDENATPSVENQNKIAYSAAKEAKDSGKTPAQFASEWNSGRANAYKEGLKGTNSKGVNYDVPAYVAKFSQHYNELKSQGSALPQNQTSPIQAESQGNALGTAAKITDTIFGSGKVGEAIGAANIKNDLAKNPESFIPTTQAAGLKDTYANLSPANRARLEAKGLPTTFEGNVKDATQIAANNVPSPTGRELLGSISQSALLALPEGKIAETLGVGAKALGAGEKLAGFLGKTAAGTATGYGYDVANNLQDNKTGAGIIKPGVATALGAATPLALLGGKALIGGAKAAPAVAGSLGEGIGNVLGAPFRFLNNKIENAVAVSKLPEAEKVLAKSGFDERSRNFLTTATPETKKVFGNMVDLAEKNSTDLRARTQPKQAVGQEFLKPVDAIAQDSKKAGEIIKAESMKPGKVDIVKPINEFVSSLESRGVLARKDGTLVSTGRVPRADLKYYESILKEIQDVTQGKGTVSRAQAHALRQRLFDTLDAETRTSAKPGSKPFSNLVDNDVNLLRRKIAEQLGPAYKDAAQRYAENNKALSAVAKFAGVPNKIEDISSKSLKLGEGLLRSLGNAADKPTSLINDITTLAGKRGFKSKTNLHDLIDFADNLEDLYGIRQTRSFEGGIRRGTEQSAPGIPKGKMDLLIKAAQSATKTTNQDKINALKKFLGK